MAWRCPSVCQSVLMNGPLLGTLNFRNFFKFIVFKNHLRNKPHLHIKGANKLKMRFIRKHLMGFVGYLHFLGYFF